MGLAGLAGCKARKQEQDIERIKKNLKAMLEKPVDMNQARMDEAKQRFTAELETLLKKPDPTVRARVIKEIQGEVESLKVKLMGEEIVAVGLSPDKWTVNGEPAAIVIWNQGTDPVQAVLSAGTGAPPEVYPLTVLLSDGRSAETKKYIFKEIGSLQVQLPEVKGGEKELFIISTDKTWTPGTHDKRKLGVRLSVSLQPFLSQLQRKNDPQRREKLLSAIFSGEVSDFSPIVEPSIGGVSLTPDGWTTALGPSGLAVRNQGKAALIPEITLSCNAKPEELPITATFDDGQTQQTVVFKKAGHQLVSLAALEPGQQRFYLVSTDRTWDSGNTDRPRLGVRITNPLDGALRTLFEKSDPKRRAKLIEDMFTLDIEKISVLGDLAVAIGLSGDRWTVDGEPAGLAVHNPGEAAFTPSIMLSCGAQGKDTPITAFIDDGQKKQQVVFNNPGGQEITLSPVAPGEKKLYIITTDKIWTPGTHDKRFLGVNVGVTLGSVLRGMLKGQKPQARAKIAAAIMRGSSVDKAPLGDYFVGLGLSADRWTVDGEPAALVGFNAGDKTWAPRVMLSVGAKDKDLPVTVTIDDGVDEKPIVFKKADSQLATLSPIEPGQYRLYVVNTDKTWSLEPQDPRALGVNLGAAPGNRPPGAPRKMDKLPSAPGAPAEPKAAAAGTGTGG